MAVADGVVVEDVKKAPTPPVAVTPVAPPAPEPGKTEIPPETSEVPETEGAENEQPSEEGGDGPKQDRTPKWAKERFASLTKSWREAERERDELAARLAAYEKTETQQEESPVPAVDPKKIGELIEQEGQKRAEAIVSQRTQAENLERLGRAGAAEYKDFTDRCNTLADLGAGERPEFMQAVLGMDDGHKIIAELADKPDEAVRILRLAPMAMAVELAKMSARMSVAPAPKTRGVSQAPKPIIPIDGTAKTNDAPSPEDSDEEWMRKRMAQRKAKGARF